MKGNMNKMMKQVQEMQNKMKQLQEELEAREFEGSAGGGVVKAVVNGKNEVLSISIDPETVDPEDVEMLQDLVLAAVNEALNNAQTTVADEMGSLTGGLKVPGLF